MPAGKSRSLKPVKISDLYEVLTKPEDTVVLFDEHNSACPVIGVSVPCTQFHAMKPEVAPIDTAEKRLASL